MKLDRTTPSALRVKAHEAILASKLCACVYRAGDQRPPERNTAFRTALRLFCTPAPAEEDFVHAELAATSPEQLYAFAVTSGGTLFLCFRGTSNVSDGIADIDLLPRAEVGGGSVHSGFAGRADTVSADYIVDVADRLSLRGGIPTVRRIVVCGHSLGGAISGIVALRVKNRLTALGRREQRDDGLVAASGVVCCAFASPLFGDDKVRSYIDTHGWTADFVNYIDERDLVPAALRLHDLYLAATNTASGVAGSFFSSIEKLAVGKVRVGCVVRGLVASPLTLTLGSTTVVWRVSDHHQRPQGRMGWRDGLR